jgi:hypothetical protein
VMDRRDAQVDGLRERGDGERGRGDARDRGHRDLLSLFARRSHLQT